MFVTLTLSFSSKLEICFPNNIEGSLNKEFFRDKTELDFFSVLK